MPSCSSAGPVVPAGRQCLELGVMVFGLGFAVLIIGFGVYTLPTKKLQPDGLCSNSLPPNPKPSPLNPSTLNPESDHTPRKVMPRPRKVDIRLPGKGNSKSRGARPVY